MSEQAIQEMSEYEKFRLLRLANKVDDDNISAHFSNMSPNMSMIAKSQRQIKINSFSSSKQNEKDFKQIASSFKNQKNPEMTNKYLELQEKYLQLLKMYKAKEDQAQKYKKLYHEELNRERQTKQKLKNWVKEAKTNLNR